MVIPFARHDMAPYALVAIGQETKRLRRGIRDIEDPREKIHQIRVSCKRLRALLFLMRPALQPLCYRHEKSQICLLAKKLGATRDQDVRWQTLNLLLQGRAEPALLLRLSDGLRRDPVAASTELDAELLEAEAASLLKLKKRSRNWSIKRFREKQLRHQLSRQYRKGRHLWLRLQEHSSESRLHAWRTETKGFYLQLSCLLPGKRKAKLRKRFKRLTEVLGQLHDLHMLRDWIADHRIGFYQDDLNRLAQLMQQREAALLSKIWPLAEKIYQQKPKPLVANLLDSWKRGAAAV